MSTAEIGVQATLEKVTQVDAKDGSHQPQIKNRDVPFATLDRSDERPVQFALISQLLLGQTPLLSPFADPFTEALEELFVV